MADPAADPLGTLQRYFGHASFRAGQRDLVEAVLEGRDLLAVMPTGAGKSLGFQLPAVLLPGMTLVVSLGLSQRRAARLIPVRLETLGYHSTRDRQDPVRQRLRELAASSLLAACGS